MQDVEVIENAGAAAAALDPVRSRLLTELVTPASAAGLAARVGIARQKVNYHLRALEAHLVPFQDDMLHARGGQLVAHGESGLTGPDHHHIDVTDPAEIPHHSRVERPQGTRSRYNYPASPDDPEPLGAA